MTNKPFSPVFSIIIPTYNRPARLANCLSAIAQLDYPRDRFEVIVVDDGSKTSMESVVTPFGDQLQLTLIRQSNSGPAAARNAGAAQANGRFLVFTDDDCMPAADWLKTLEMRFAESPDCLIGGRALNALPDNLYSTASQVLIDYLYSHYNINPSQSSFFASNNIALPTDHFHAVGGFDTSFPLAAAEDREFCNRWLHCGYRMIYAFDVQVKHAHFLTLKSFWRQHFNYGRGAFCFHQARTQYTNERIKFESLKFYLHLLTYPLLQKSSQPGILLTILFLISQVANVAGFFWEQWHQSAKETKLTDTNTNFPIPTK